MIGRVLVLAWKELIQLRRDRLTLAMTAVLPIMQLLLFGYAVNTDVRHIRTVVFDEDRSAESRDLARTLSATGYFDLIGEVAGYPEVERALRSGTAGAALVVGQHFSQDLAAGATAHVQLVLDGSDPQTVGAASDAASGFVTARGATLAAERAARAGLPTPRPPVDLALNILYNPEQRSAVNIVPGLVGVILSLTMVMLTSMAIARERERGTLEQLIVSPVRTVEIVVGKILPYVGIGYVQMALVLLAGVLVFQVHVAGSLALLFALAFVFIAANLAVGLLFSTLAKTQQQAMQMSIFFLLPNILLSGFVFPFDAMPFFAKVPALALPLTHFIRVVRGIALKSSGFSDLRTELWWMTGILVSLVALSSLRFRKKLL
ncbi:MAG: ABC transporter permease [Myxococcales bacterium]|nr:ABC transporter permease [Myxococcales bacterium]